MYAIVRMGPYDNAEWDTGGLPVWLRFGHPGLLPMSDNPQFYSAVTPYFNKLIPILAANQINRGGPILMVQMENEHVLPGGAGGGTDIANPYYRWFYAKMRTMGMSVPLFFSGLNHSDNPAGDQPFDASTRTSPWYSTEFWTGWVGKYGYDPDRAKLLERSTWKVIAFGGAGYTHYTLAGGTDFDTWNNNEQAASYDFGSPIGQAGDLRPGYYSCKRAAMFATSFAPLLANSLASDGGDGVTSTDGNVQLTNRKGPAGEALFLSNHTGSAIGTQIKIDGLSYPAAGPLSIASGEMVPVLRHYPLAPGIMMTLAAARLLGTATAGTLTTLVVYGNPGEPVELHFRAPKAHLLAAATGLTFSGDMVTLKTTVPAATPRVSAFSAGSQTLRVLTMPTELANRTWFLLNDSLIACGPDYVGEASLTPAGTLHLAAEQNGLSAAPANPPPNLLFLPDASKKPLRLLPLVPTGPQAHARPPALGPWHQDASVPQAQPGYNDAAWKSSLDALAMGADGDYSAYAWYRTAVSVPAAGTYQINLTTAADWVSCFVNGKPASTYRNPAPKRLPVELKSGVNTLAFLTAHSGRDKLFNYYGPMDLIDAKGISGLVTLSKPMPADQEINAFRWQADDQAPGDFAKQAAPDLDTKGAGWTDADTSTDVFHDRIGWAWFRAALPNATGPGRRLFFHSIDDKGEVFLNGKLLNDSVGLNADVFVPLDSAWRDGGPNILAVAVQNTGGPGGMTGEVRLESGIAGGTDITHWKMHGGISYPAYASPSWKPAQAGGPSGIPTFYHAAFTATPPGESGPHPVLRVSTYTLSRGFVWLNGRNLGRYPEKSPVDGVYLPESILRSGKNDLVIFDEDGNNPSGVKILVEDAASRTGIVLTAAAK